MELEQLYSIFLSSTGVNTDTRHIIPGSIFFALKGENFDGNKFTDLAIEKGAKLAVIDHPDFFRDGKTILVHNTLETLQELAKIHRKNLSIPIIGLTGSNGKTTTKELISAVLNKKFKAFATAGNLNNHIGVPLSILSIKEDCEIAVIEMGANHVGEIAFLCSISQPTHGLITNIGKAHIGEFGGFENIIRGKSELYHFLIKNHGQVFINSRQPVLLNMAKRFKNPLLYPKKEEFYYCELKSISPYLTLLTGSGKEVKTQLIGQYNFDNIATALCIGKYFHVREEDAIKAIEEYSPSNNRSQIINTGKNTLILDAYNANPSSMEAAIDNLTNTKKDQKMVILGDMFELGDQSASEHQVIGKILSTSDIHSILLVGKWMKYAHEMLEKSLYFETRDDLIKHLETHQYTNQLILIKGSRSMGLEKTVEHL